MEIRTVLCPIDFSPLAEREVDLAVEVCDAFRARLVLHLNVLTAAPGFSKTWEWEQAHRGQDEPSAADAERRIEALRRRLPSAISADAVVTYGPLATAVLALAQQYSADLLILGDHGWSTEDHASVAERVLEQTQCPVLTIRDAAARQTLRLRPGPGEERLRLVVPTDLSPSANQAVAYAFELARRLPVQVDLLHVAHAAALHEAQESLMRLIPADLGARAQCHVRVGRPDQEIERFLGEIEPALVVMGTHARRFWRRLFTRDVARELLHTATCPVCFVPPTVAT